MLLIHATFWTEPANNFKNLLFWKGRYFLSEAIKYVGAHMVSLWETPLYDTNKTPLSSIYRCLKSMHVKNDSRLCPGKDRHTALFESEEMPSAFSSEVRYLSMRSEKSR